MGVVARLTGLDKDLGGGLRVRRLLPAAGRQSVGPFVFFDHFGPVEIGATAEVDVRPHPHIGLATVTFLFDGALMHRDSLGNEQRIEPGAVNWMTAGRGIVHSERRPDDLRGRSYRAHGLQLWAALPRALEDCPPAFEHTPADRLPAFDTGGLRGRVLVGSAFGVRSPVTPAAPTLYAVLDLAAGTAATLPPLAAQLALYPVDADVTVDGESVARGTLAVLDGTRPAPLAASQATRVALLGGEPLDGRRLIWWNFVSTRRERILAAAADWEAGRLGRIAGDESFIPLPTDRPVP
ncbi:MAG: pirin family protein [Proteobacteria bacterium]|nr:pirin family protein [Pseudomonadota bacterium]